MINKQKIKLLIKELAYKYNYDIKTVDQFEVRNDLKTYKKLYRAEAIKKKQFYNIGAGCFRHEAWTNIDKESDWYKTATAGNKNIITLDLFDKKSFPIKTETAKAIYCSHIIEHITNDAVQKMFKESYRILEKGKIIRIITPNSRRDFEAYKEKDWDYFYWLDAFSSQRAMDRVKINKPLREMSLEEIFLLGFATSTCESCTENSKETITAKEVKRIFKEKELEEAFDYCVSKCQIEVHRKNAGFHMNWFTEEKLGKMLKEAGFEIIYKSQYLQSKCPVMRNKYYFDQTAPEISLYMEAKK